MTEIAPVKDWATDFDVLDPRYVDGPLQHLGRPAGDLPDRPHEPAQEQLAADPLRGRHGHCARHRALQLPQGGGDPRRRGRGPQRRLRRPQPGVRAAAHLLGPAAAHLDPPAPAALVLAQAGRRLRAADAGPVHEAAGRVRRLRACGRRGRLRAADPGPGHRPHPGRLARPLGHLHGVGARRAGVRRRRRAPPARRRGTPQLLPGTARGAARQPGRRPPERAPDHRGGREARRRRHRARAWRRSP